MVKKRVSLPNFGKIRDSAMEIANVIIKYSPGRYKNRFLVTISRRACISLPSGAKTGNMLGTGALSHPACPRAL